MSQKLIAARNAVIRMKEAARRIADVENSDDMESISRGKTALDGIVPAGIQTVFPGNDHFFMMTDGTRFFCMERSGAHDVTHASFFSEIRCRGHMKNSHNLT